MWEKIVLNLLSNAFKFTFEGSVRDRRSGDARHRVELDVRDTGVGIPERGAAARVRALPPRRGRPSRTHEGSGIGLALTSRAGPAARRHDHRGEPRR